MCSNNSFVIDWRGRKFDNSFAFHLRHWSVEYPLSTFFIHVGNRFCQMHFAALKAMTNLRGYYGWWHNTWNYYAGSHEVRDIMEHGSLDLCGLLLYNWRQEIRKSRTYAQWDHRVSVFSQFSQFSQCSQCSQRPRICRVEPTLWMRETFKWDHTPSKPYKETS